jgi:hypothetical protein
VPNVAIVFSNRYKARILRATKSIVNIQCSDQDEPLRAGKLELIYERWDMFIHCKVFENMYPGGGLGCASPSAVAIQQYVLVQFCRLA